MICFILCRSLSGWSYLTLWQPTSRCWSATSWEPCLFVSSTTAGVGISRPDLWVICSDLSQWLCLWNSTERIIYFRFHIQNVHLCVEVNLNVGSETWVTATELFLSFCVFCESRPTLSLMSVGTYWAWSLIREWYGEKTTLILFQSAGSKTHIKHYNFHFCG